MRQQVIELITLDDVMEDTDSDNFINNYQTFQPQRQSVIQLNPMFSHPTLRTHQ